MRRIAILLLGLAAATPALAHVGPGGHGGFAAGFAHPIGGIDHLLAMVAVGLLAIRIGGRARWALPAAFLAAITAGVLIGLGGEDWPPREIAIAGSVLAFGLMLAVGRRWPVAVAATVVAAFALFHGFAHAIEAPPAASFPAYGAGLLAATALLHLLGIGLALAAGRLAGGGLLATRLGGVAIMACGLVLLTG